MSDHESVVTVGGVHHLVRHRGLWGSSTWCGLWTRDAERSGRQVHVCHACVVAHADQHNYGRTG